MATMTDDERKRAVQKIVRDCIKQVDGRNVNVTQDTAIDDSGLGHSCELRKKYFPCIAAQVEALGCKIVNLAPAAFCAADVNRVRKVTALVLGAMKC